MPDAAALALAAAVLALVAAIGLGVVLGYHRLLTHRAARVHPVVEKALVVCALAAGTPVQWVGNHRFHHAVTDTPDDPHSPRHKGFWIAHCGWYLGFTTPTAVTTALSVVYALAGPLRPLFDAFWRPRTNQAHAHLAGDVAADPFYAWISRPGPYAFVLLAWVTTLWLTFVAAWGVTGAVALASVHWLAYALGDAVNSFGHIAGRRPFGTRDEARDHPLLAFVTLGDGWHHSHHRFPGSIRAGLLPGQVDVAYLFVKLLERLGLARELRVPSPAQVEAALARPVADVVAVEEAA